MKNGIFDAKLSILFFYDKFYDRVWRSYRESLKDSQGAYYLKSITAFLKLKPKTYDETAYDHVERILADLQQELEKTESASVSTHRMHSSRKVQHHLSHLVNGCRLFFRL